MLPSLCLKQGRSPVSTTVFALCTFSYPSLPLPIFPLPGAVFSLACTVHPYSFHNLLLRRSFQPALFQLATKCTHNTHADTSLCHTARSFKSINHSPRQGQAGFSLAVAPAAGLALEGISAAASPAAAIMDPPTQVIFPTSSPGSR